MCQSCLAEWQDDDGLVQSVVHMVVVDSSQGIIDPSFDVGHNANVFYAPTVKASLLGCGGQIQKGLSKREAIRLLLEFVEFAKHINQGKVIVSDKSYYNTQADFIDTLKDELELRFQVNSQSMCMLILR